MLVQRIRSAVRQTPGIFDNLTANLEAGIPGVSFKIGSETPGDPILGLSEWLEQDRYPVLFSLDEAHEADPLVLGRLLNVVQLAGQPRPVGAVLAGTPGLLDTLAASRASFWSRGEKLAVGLLPDGEARAVLARPFLDVGLGADADVVAKLACAADDYPYFLQLYSAAAWDAVQAIGAGGLRPEHVATAVEATSVPRRKYYRERYEEFRRANALPLARDVALAFSRADRPMTDSRLDELLARHSRNGGFPMTTSAAGHSGSPPSGVRNASRHSMVSRGFRIGSRDSLNPLRRIHWISPIHTDTRASSAA